MTDIPRLQSVVWELTLGCNLHCKYCGSGAGNARPNELSPVEALALCDEFTALGVERVTLMGGEPLMRSDILDIVARLTRSGIATDIVSNGSLLSSELAFRLRDLNLYGLSLSMDGPKAVHDVLRRRVGHFESVGVAVQRGQEAGLSVGIVSHINRFNFNHLDEMYEILCDWCVNGWQIQLTSPLGFARNRDVVITYGQFMELHRWALAKQQDAALHLYFADDIGYFHPQEVALRGSKSKNRCWQGCSAGLRTVGIASDGRVRGCMSLPERFTEDSVRRRLFREIWNDPQLFGYNRQPAELHGNCRGCVFSTVCRGGCLSSSYALTGRFRDVSYCWHALNGTR